MALLFQGFVYDDLGDAVTGATANLYDRNTTTPVRATTTTDSAGLWTVSHGTEGQFDVEIVSGASKQRLKYDDAIQIQEMEVNLLNIRGSDDAFNYVITPAAIAAERILNLPLITGTDTLVVTTLAQTLANKTLTAPTIAATGWTNANHTHTAANRGGQVTLPALDIDGGTDIGAAIVDADLLIIDDGAGGTNRKAEASRFKTYVGAATGAFAIANLDIDGGTDIGAGIVGTDLFIVDDGAGGTNRKTAASRLKAYIGAGVAGYYTTTTTTNPGDTLGDDSLNVASLARNATGDYTVTWDVSFANANYAATVTSESTDLGTIALTHHRDPQTGSLRYGTNAPGDPDPTASVDSNHHVIAFGNQ
ncbi:hypothetical protein CMI37_14895 [Candidatus Pacearchaeota archaeon]|nr:hypothetical protein [Candidatus Pacearchaeota archaeon]